jgi:hypothetical protein
MVARADGGQGCRAPTTAAGRGAGHTDDTATGRNRDMTNVQGSYGRHEESEQRAIEVLTFEAVALIVFVALIGALVVAQLTGVLDGLIREITILPAA